MKPCINFRIIFILTVAIFLLSPACKKNPTTVEVEDLTRPVIWVNTFDMSFSASTSGENPSPQTLQIKNSGASTIEYTLDADADWLNISDPEGSSNGQIVEHTITVDKSELKASVDPYSATLTISCDQAYNNPQRISVLFEVTDTPVKPPKIVLSPSKLNFTAQVDGAAPALQKITISNGGSGVLKYQAVPDAAWLAVTPSSGQVQTSDKNLKVSVNPAGMSPGSHTGTILITDPAAGNSPRKVTVTLTMTDTPLPRIRTSATRLTFEAAANGADPPPQYLFIGNSGGGTLNYTLTGDVSWLSISPMSGKSTGEDKRHTVTVSSNGMTSGTHTATIRVSAPAAQGGDQTVRVVLNISAPLTDNKIGISVSPTNGPTGTTVTLSINVSGNTSEIKVFGLEVHFDPGIFNYQSTATGSLTGGWAAVGGNEISTGTIKIGGFSGSGSSVGVGSSGTIATVTLQVTGGAAAGGTKTQLSINNFSDDIIAMMASPASFTFTYIN